MLLTWLNRTILNLYRSRFRDWYLLHVSTELLKELYYDLLID